jgi:hypothetical protein
MEVCEIAIFVDPKQPNISHFMFQANSLTEYQDLNPEN